MKAKDLGIPGLPGTPLELVKNKKNLTSSPQVVFVPVLNIVYTDSTGSPQRQVENLRAELALVRSFYLENSWGKFTFNFRIRTVVMDVPKDELGNLAGIEPDYSGPGHALVNLDDFPEPSDYTGTKRVTIWSHNPGSVLEKDRTEVRKYDSQAAKNRVENAMLTTRRMGLIHSYDDNFSFLNWLNFGIPSNFNSTGAFILFTSTAFGGGKTTSFPGSPIGIGDRALGRCLFSQTGSESSWGLIAHELGHAFWDAKDAYGREREGNTITRISKEGYLGQASVMGNHWDGPHFDALMKFKANFLDPRVLTPNTASETIELLPIYQDANQAILIRPNVTQYPDEFFLLEVRGKGYSNWRGTPVEFDHSLGASLDGGLFVYHVHSHGATGGGEGEAGIVRDAAPLRDLEGEPEGSLNLVSIRLGKTVDLEGTSFYDNAENGLEIKVLAVDASGKHTISITWNREPNLCAVTAKGNNFLVLSRKKSGEPQTKAFNGSSWSPSISGWSGLGGKTLNTPCANTNALGDRVRAFVRGTSKKVFTKLNTDGVWPTAGTNWEDLGGETSGTPTSVTWKGATYVFAKEKSSSTILFKSFNGTTWSPSVSAWKRLAGAIAGSPKAVGDDTLGLHLFARDASGNPLHKSLQGTTWTPSLAGWRNLGGKVNTDIIGIKAFERIQVFARAVNGRLFHKSWDGVNWAPSATTWHDLGGQCMGPPAVVFRNDRIYVFVTGISGKIFCKSWRLNHVDSPSDWIDLGGSFVDSPAALVSDGKIHVFGTGVDGKALFKVMSGSVWPSNWTSLGGEIG